MSLRVCSQCEVSKPTHKFSTRQLHKGTGFSRCRDCVSGRYSHRNAQSTARYNYTSVAIFRRRDLQHPFEEGGFRYVAIGRHPSSSGQEKLCVAKWFKTGNVTSSYPFRADLNCVAKAIEFVRAFNAERIIDSQIRVNMPQVRQFGRGTGLSGVKYMLERYIHHYDKWNSNSGWADTSSQWALAMQALSHYSFHKSGGQYLLCDLQGGLDDGEGPVLSDPAILSRDMKYGVTDLGSEGIANFFALHRCNKYCRRWSRPRSRHVRQLFSVRRGTTFMGFGDTVGSSASRDTHRVHSRRTRGTVRTLSTQTSDHSHHQHHHGGSQHSHPAHDEAYYVPVEEEDEQSDYGEENVVYYEEEDGDESAAGEDSADSEDATKYDVDADYYYYYQEENTAEDEHEA